MGSRAKKYRQERDTGFVAGCVDYDDLTATARRAKREARHSMGWKATSA